jgi:hypothetical protein
VRAPGPPRRIRAALSLVAAFLAACSTAPAARPSPAPSPSSLDAGDIACTGLDGASPRFSLDVAPVLRSCVHGETCHPSGWNYANLVNAPTRRDPCQPPRVLVSPGAPAESYLLDKLTGVGMCPGSQRMPIGPPLAPSQIQTIADWICAGAPDD